MKLKQIALAAAIAATGSAAFAQSSSVTIYGNIDQNITHLSGGPTGSITELTDGGYLKSRFGFKGEEDLGGDLKAKFNLEAGCTANTGACSSTALFDRQSWVGFSSNSWGDFRLGKQNTATFYRGDYVDYTSRTLGSVVNGHLNGFVPSRVQNDVSYISPRINGVLVELHRSIPGTAGNTLGSSVTQAAIDYLNGPFRVGYTGNWMQPAAGAAHPDTLKYDQVYANYEYIPGSKIYATYIKTNVAASSTSSAVAASPGPTALDGATGSAAKGDFDIYQISADYRVTPSLRVGALWGKIKDNSGQGKGATGESAGAYYDLSKRTMLYTVVMRLANESQGLANVNGSNGLSSSYVGDGLKGLSQTSYTVGILHRF